MTGEGQKILETNSSRSHDNLFLFSTAKCKLPVGKKVTVWVTDPEGINRAPYYFYLHYGSPERNFIHGKLGF